MKLNSSYIIVKNKQYKNNIKSVASKKGVSLKALSVKLGMQGSYISNMCAKKSSIVSNNLLHKISIILECSFQELNHKI